GFGWIAGYVLYCPLIEYFKDFDHFYRYERGLESIFVATIAFCAGIALIIVYLIERKASKEAKKAE
ncbi:MAG: hypothetical protein FWF70_00050, partial [Bacteroidetes bacterium]|nr:hypothetical protein [Bacteroidota bacterium]